ncbi:MAG: MFS transporter [Clostridia bacterium]|nr:MFS transporter [Clostridia bacterium]
MKSFFLFSKETKGEGYVPNNEIFALASGLTGQNLTYSYTSSWLKYFCVNILHMDPAKVGGIFSLSHVWDAINDPIVGGFVDRRNYKTGMKLRPFLLYTPPFLGILVSLMFINVNFSENGKIAYILVLYFLFDLFYSFQDVSLWGMIALSSPHSQERSRVAQWVSIGAGAGGALVGTFQQVRSILTSFGMTDVQIFLICAFVFGLGGELLSMNAYRMKERIHTEVPKDENLLTSLTILRHNPTLLLISLARFSQGFSPKVQNAYFFENCVTLKVGNSTVNGQTAEFMYGLFAGIPGTFAMFFANKIADKIGGMKRILLSSQIFAIGLRVLIYFVGYNSLPKFIIMTVLTSLINLPGSMMDIAHRSLTSDSIDEVEYKTGIRSEGVSFSMQNFTTKMTSGVSSIIEGQLLKRLGYDSYAKEAGLAQNETFIKWQWPMFVLGPVVGAVLYLIIICFVKDNKERRDEIEQALKERRRLLEEEKAAVAEQ